MIISCSRSDIERDGSLAGLAGADAADLAQRCIDNTYGEVAVVNNSDAAIRRP